MPSTSLIQTPLSAWNQSADVVVAGFDKREIVAWTRDRPVQSILAARGWDGTLPAGQGDFLANSEFDLTFTEDPYHSASATELYAVGQDGTILHGKR